jgi:AbrB family looped-hinge helix DNA binding protein
MIGLSTSREETRMSALTKVTRHGQITLPRSVRGLLNIEEGDFVEIDVVEGRAVLT